MIVTCLTILFCAFASHAGAANVAGRPLVVIALPQGENDQYYGKWYPHIRDFQVNYTKAIIEAGNDNVIIIATDKEPDAWNDVACMLPAGHVLKGTLGDIWTRDFTTVLQKDPVEFKFWPNYQHPESLRTEIRTSFNDVLKQHGITPETAFTQSELILDGGNSVDNGLDTTLITSRVYTDNVNFTKAEVRQMLKDALKLPNIAIVDEIAGDTTGHTDGMVSFLDTNQLAMVDYEDCRLNKKYLRQIKRQIPDNIEITLLPNRYAFGKKWSPPGDPQTFTSACGLHINALATTNNYYIPTFGTDPENQQEGRNYDAGYDQQVVDIIKSKTTKTVVEVPVPYKVCRMGGSVRCLSWQLEGTVADQLVAAANSAIQPVCGPK